METTLDRTTAKGFVFGVQGLELEQEIILQNRLLDLPGLFKHIRALTV